MKSAPAELKEFIEVLSDSSMKKSAK